MSNLLKWVKRAVSVLRQRILVVRVNKAKKKAKKKAQGFAYRENSALSIIIQSFNHVSNVDQIMTNLRKAEALEIIVCEDGSIDGAHQRWMKHLVRPNDFLFHSNDLHEIRTTDRAISLSRGEFVCLIQDDDLLPSNDRWIRHALDLFDAYPSLGCLGGYMGFPEYETDEHFQGFSVRDGKLKCHNPIPTRDPHTGHPFMFVENVNIGPFFLRKSAFYSVGGWDFSFSDVGKPGMGYDHEMGYRMWSRGFQVGLYYAPQFNSEYNELAGKGGTYLWGRADRDRAFETFPKKIRALYESEQTVIRKRVCEANAPLISTYTEYFEESSEATENHNSK